MVSTAAVLTSQPCWGHIQWRGSGGADLIPPKHQNLCRRWGTFLPPNCSSHMAALVFRSEEDPRSITWWHLALRLHASLRSGFFSRRMSSPWTHLKPLQKLHEFLIMAPCKTCIADQPSDAQTEWEINALTLIELCPLSTLPPRCVTVSVLCLKWAKFHRVWGKGGGGVWSSRFKIATERESAIDVKAAQKWVFLAFWLKWRAAIVTGGKVKPGEDLLSSAPQAKPEPLGFGISFLSHLPPPSLSTPSLTTPHSFLPPRALTTPGVKAQHGLMPRSVPHLPFSGQAGSGHLLSRGPHTGDSQLKCSPFASSMGSERRHPDAPVNIYCSNKIHHSLPSAPRQHA